MQMFEHDDITTTLHYILSDPLIRDALRDALGERRAEININIAENLDKCSDSAAIVLRDVREKFFDELEIPQNERMQKRRMSQFVAAKLEEGGFDIKIIWPGIICIKSLEQRGLCVEPGREPNPPNVNRFAPPPTGASTEEGRNSSNCRSVAERSGRRECRAQHTDAQVVPSSTA